MKLNENLHPSYKTTPSSNMVMNLPNCAAVADILCIGPGGHLEEEKEEVEGLEENILLGEKFSVCFKSRSNLSDKYGNIEHDGED